MARFAAGSSTFRGRPFLGLGRWTGGSFGLGFMIRFELFASTSLFAFDLNGKGLKEVDRACGDFGCGQRSCCVSKEYLFGGVILAFDFARRMSILICNEGKETCRYFTDALMDGESQGRRQECYHNWVQPARDISAACVINPRPARHPFPLRWTQWTMHDDVYCCPINPDVSILEVSALHLTDIDCVGRAV